MIGNKIEKLESEIQRLAYDMGATRIGFANMEDAYNKAPFRFEEPGKLLTGISIGMDKEDALVDGLPITDEEYRTDHYVHKIGRALRIGDRIAEMLIENGFRAIRLAHPPKDSQRTGLYKMVARYAGMGWIGKNHLLITPDHGPRLALATVLTNAPTTSTGKPMEQLCRGCTLCIDICPVNAFEDMPLDESDPLKSFVPGLCGAFRGTINPTLWGGCGLCVKVCPYGQPK